MERLRKNMKIRVGFTKGMMLLIVLTMSTTSMLAQSTLKKPTRPQKEKTTTTTTPRNSTTSGTNKSSQTSTSSPTRGSSSSQQTKVSEPTGYINGHGYVDLGLSVKWATCNVGASSPSDYGNYYAWGETRTKSDYSTSNSVTYGKSMGSIAGNSTYDAARANWGGTWRLPTSSEIDELISKCKREWTTYGGKKGYKVTGPNGNSIFLPAAGWRDGTSLNDAGEGGYYWSATPHEDNAGNAYGLYFYGGGFYRGWGSRNGGRSVRPVSE